MSRSHAQLVLSLLEKVRTLPSFRQTMLSYVYIIDYRAVSHGKVRTRCNEACLLLDVPRALEALQRPQCRRLVAAATSSVPLKGTRTRRAAGKARRRQRQAGTKKQYARAGVIALRQGRQEESN
jgi:hypothetical protein